MKLLIVEAWTHVKNRHAINNYKFDYTVVHKDQLGNVNINDYTHVYSPCIALDVNKYPETKFIFGPHFSIFPEERDMNLINGENSIYIQPSNWVVNLWKNHPLSNSIKMSVLPFGVDTEKFNKMKPLSERSKVFIYYKRRDPEELKILENFLNFKKIEYKIFSYTEKYDENTYLDYLHNSKYGIWLGCHESQGFGLEEALSCNVPLLVWNVTSMNQEYGCNYDDIPATSIPYWDERCGESFTKLYELLFVYEKFISKLEKYSPREYILENISFEKCEQKMLDIIENI